MCIDTLKTYDIFWTVCNPLANLLTGAQHVASVLDLLGRVKEYDVHGGIVMLRPMSTHDYQWPIMTNALQWYCNFKIHDYQNLNSYLKNNQSPMQYREVYQDYTVCILCVSMYKGTTASETECCSKRCGYSKHVDVHDSCRRSKLVKLQEPIACNSLSKARIAKMIIYDISSVKEMHAKCNVPKHPFKLSQPDLVAIVTFLEAIGQGKWDWENNDGRGICVVPKKNFFSCWHIDAWLPC